MFFLKNNIEMDFGLWGGDTSESSYAPVFYFFIYVKKIFN